MEPTNNLKRIPTPIPVMKPKSYNDNSSRQKECITQCLPFLQSSAKDAVLPPSLPQPFVIADFGCSQGANSMLPVHLIIQEIERRVPGSQFQVFHIDLPQNDFGSLFEVLETSATSYVKQSKSPRVYPAVIGKSFYLPVLPPNSIHFGFSFTSVHWLSGVPCKVKGHPLYYQADEKELKLWQDWARKDLLAFFNCRKEEIVKGGKLFLTVPIVSNWAKNIWSCLFDESFAKMRKDGIITEEELDNINIPFYFRSQEDIDEVLHEVRDSFAINSITTMHDHHHRGKILAPAEWEAVFEPIIASCLSCTRNPTETEAILVSMMNNIKETVKNLVNWDGNFQIPMSVISLTRI